MKTLEELQAIRDKMKSQISNRGIAGEGDTRVVVGMATCGIAAGARGVLTALTEEISKRNLTNVKLSQTGCIGICKFEPIVEVFAPGQEKVTYVNVTPAMAATIVASNIINGKIVDEYTYSNAIKD